MLRRKVVDERRRRKGGVKEEVGMGLEVLRRMGLTRWGGFEQVDGWEQGS